MRTLKTLNADTFYAVKIVSAMRKEELQCPHKLREGNFSQVCAILFFTKMFS